MGGADKLLATPYYEVYGATHRGGDWGVGVQFPTAEQRRQRADMHYEVHAMDVERAGDFEDKQATGVR